MELSGSYRSSLAETHHSSQSLVIDQVPLFKNGKTTLFRARLKSTNEAVIVKRFQKLHVPKQPRAGCSVDTAWELAVHDIIHRRGGHANIVRALGVIFNDDSVDLILEECVGGDLYNHLLHDHNRKLSEVDALNVSLQVSRAAVFLHECGIAHRDISLENVLISGTGTYKLCDFGLAQRIHGLTSLAVGKAYYMAPEVVAMKPHDPVLADIWSMGIMLFVLLTGSPLVQVASDDASDFRAFKLVGGCVGVLKQWKMEAGLSVSTLDLLDGMLQTDVNQRFQTVQELLLHQAMVAAASRFDHLHG